MPKNVNNSHKKCLCSKTKVLQSAKSREFDSTASFDNQLCIISTKTISSSHSEIDNSDSSKKHSKFFKNSEEKSLNKLQIEIERYCNDLCPTKKLLTLQLVDKLINIKTPNKLKFANIVYVKVIYPDAPCPFAIELQSYDTFNEFFDPLILELQCGSNSTDFCMGPTFGDYDKLEYIDLNENKNILRVIYADITVRRNLSDFDLAGHLSTDERNTIRDILKAKCKETFLSLSPVTLPTEWVERIKMIEPHLSYSMAMKEYPNGRLNMAFKDDEDGVLGCIINYDDHLQIITSTNNGRIGHIYNQIAHIMSSNVFCKMDFMKHKKYGYVTFSPQFIGTGFNIRIFLKLPFVAMLDDVDELYLKDLGLSLRQNVGERKDLLILTNKKTLNITEINIYNNILEAYQRLYELENELETTCPNAVNEGIMPVENLHKLVTKIYNFDMDHTYTKKYLNDSLINQYNGIITQYGGLFNHCIRANAFYSKSLFPKAADSDCFSTFYKFFNPIILETNNARIFCHNHFQIYENAYSDNRYKLKHNLIKGYRVRFSRNFEDYPFPMTITSTEREHIELQLIDCFATFSSLIKGRYIKLENIKKDKIYNFLNNLNIIPKSTNYIKKASWTYKDWPKNRGIFVADKDELNPFNILTILINEDDHIQISCLNYKGESLDYCYDRAVVCIKHIDIYFNNAYSKKPFYGFLSSNPQNVGCCMRVGAHVLLENLGRNMSSLNDFCFLNKMNYRGVHGSGSDPKNFIFDISLKLNLNYSEIQILMLFIQRLKDLILEERTFDYTILKPNVEEVKSQPPTIFTYTSQNGYENDLSMTNTKDSKDTNFLSKPMSSFQTDTSKTNSVNETSNILVGLKVLY